MISNCHKNIMGTISFDGRFGNMRKAQDFIVYPKSESGPLVTIQSDHRFGQINLDTGALVLSENRKQYANSITLALSIRDGTELREILATEELQTLRGFIKSSAGLEVGSCVVSDNTGAFEFMSEPTLKLPLTIATYIEHRTVKTNLVEGTATREGRCVAMDVRNEQAREIVRRCNAIDAITAAAKQAQCDCSPKERDSGHKSCCWFPQLQQAITDYESH